jgi:hypothetical protein
LAALSEKLWCDNLPHNMQFDYSLSSMLPFARAAIRETSDFSPQQFAELLFDQLANANVPGVVRQGSPAVGRYNFSDLQVPYALKQGVIEIFWHLVHRGFILPEAQSFPQDYNRGRYRKTRTGTAWASGTSSVEPLPEDVRGYMAHLSSNRDGLRRWARDQSFRYRWPIGAGML